MSDQNRNVINSLNAIRDAILAAGGGDALPCGTADYPQLKNGPDEVVLAFNNNETIKLVQKGKQLYFSSHGVLTDLCHKELPGTKVETTFPVRLEDFAGTTQWPVRQKRPYDAPPLNPKNVTDNGFSKQAYWFESGSFVTVGPSLPKIDELDGGGAQFWVGSIGVISQGTGAFKGARGVTTYVGSGYFEHWPKDPGEQLEILKAGFTALVASYAKIVPAK